MSSVSGGCHCGNIRVDLVLASEPASYHPRACDCSFCRKHGAAYISDARGSLRIVIADPRSCGRYRQGNELAEMLVCSRCGVLIGALYQGNNGRVFGTVNVRAVEGEALFGSQKVVSPQVLSGDQKVARWSELWFRDVEMHNAGGS